MDTKHAQFQRQPPCKWGNKRGAPLKLETTKGRPLSSLLFNTALVESANLIIQEKEVRAIKIVKEAVKLSLFAYDLTADLSESAEQLLETVREFHKVINKSNMKKINSLPK